MIDEEFECCAMLRDFSWLRLRKEKGKRGKDWVT